jgi:hypothetical protein
MCKLCIDEGMMTQEEYDAAIAAGDKSVIPLADRVAAGEDPETVFAEFGIMERAVILAYLAKLN